MSLVLNTLEISARCFCEYSNGFGVKRGILCGRTDDYHQVAECPKDHWCTGNSNKSSEVVSAMDLCEKGNINTRQNIRAKIEKSQISTNFHEIFIQSL